jgi:FeS assembly SUF system regulator
MGSIRREIHMLRIGKLTDYATLILATLAADRTRLQNATALSERTHIAAPTVSKLLKQLHRAGLVNSARGTRGGYQLARDPESISAAAILDALEGPIALTECSSASGHCGIEHTCSVGRAWQKLNLAIRRSLNEISLAQLAGLDNRATSMPIERELRHIQRGAKVTT